MAFQGVFKHVQDVGSNVLVNHEEQGWCFQRCLRSLTLPQMYPGVLELLRIRDKCIQVTDSRIHQTSSEVSWWHGIGDHWRGPVSLLNLDELPMSLEQVPDVPGLV